MHFHCPSRRGRNTRRKLALADGARLPESISVKSWLDDVSKWPNIQWLAVQSYLDKPSLYAGESLCAYKSLDAKNYVASGHVQKILYKDLGKVLPTSFQSFHFLVYFVETVKNQHHCWFYFHNQLRYNYAP